MDLNPIISKEESAALNHAYPRGRLAPLRLRLAPYSRAFKAQFYILHIYVIFYLAFAATAEPLTFYFDLQPNDYEQFNLLNDALKVRLVLSFLLLVAFDLAFLAGLNFQIPLMLLLGATLYSSVSLIVEVEHLVILNFKTLTFLVSRTICLLSLVNTYLNYDNIFKKWAQ